ncbi:hypothetical protein ATO67_06335 [Agrobacterium bohemicum]|uniref:Uncharacterized protein n=1 Tax=Agrobacterium bohemicum TaxID=2052828 RepID=A0A135P2Q0_9HYPH|nr:hypothetical protein ATO67_06335 [Agrobacterium bohemicum]
MPLRGWVAVALPVRSEVNSIPPCPNAGDAAGICSKSTDIGWQSIASIKRALLMPLAMFAGIAPMIFTGMGV